MTAPFDALHPSLQYHIVSTLQWQLLRPTQADAVKPVLTGENVLLLAPTAGGKTEAAVFPLFSRIAAEKWDGLSILYICPLKALLNNIWPRLQLYAGFLGLRVGLWHGDVGEAERKRILREPPEILLTTPESLEAMMISSRLDHVGLLRGVRSCVVDELHAFAGDDRGWHLLFLIARLEHLSGRRIQRIGLTATVGNPEALLDWFSIGRGGHIIGPRRAPVDGDVSLDYVGSVDNAVKVLTRLYRGERRLVFAESRARVEEIATGLRQAGLRTFVSHASLSLDERRQAEAAFAAEPDCVIVATSTLELGLDVGDLDRVIQIGAPPSVASFLQRMGRTGRRAGTLRNCLFLATNRDEFLTCLGLVALWRNDEVEQITPPERPVHLFGQQVLALSLQEGGITRSDIAQWLGATLLVVPARDQEDTLNHMLATGILAQDGSVLGLGENGEREFGRRHFSDLISAFSNPLLLTVFYGTVEIGSVHPVSLVKGRADDGPIISLGGRSWKVVHINWRKHAASVVPADGGGRSRWLGLGRPLSGAICLAAEKVVAGTEPGCRLSRRAESALESVREQLPFVDGETLPFVSDGDGRITIWAFAGGLACASIAQSLAAGGIQNVAHDDFSVVVRSRDALKISELVRRINSENSHPRLPDDLGDALKFNLCIPDSLLRDVLIERTSDRSIVAQIIGRPPRYIRDSVCDE